MEVATLALAKAWYLLQCKPRQDERAEEHLNRQGYRCYRPKLTQELSVRGKRQTLESSLFPGYVFIQLGVNENWGPLRSTRGVARIVRFGADATPIPDQLIERLQQQEQGLTAQQLLAPGDKVRITNGAFAEVEAIFLTMNGDERVVLLMNILHRPQRVSLPLREVRKL